MKRIILYLLLVSTAIGSVEFDDSSGEYLSAAVSGISEATCSYSLWFKDDDGTTGTRVLFNLGNTTYWYSQHLIRVTSDNVQFQYVPSTSVYTVNATGGYTANTWHNVVVVCDGASGVSLYVDGGTPTTNATTSANFSYSESIMGIGSAITYTTSPGDYWSGKISKVARWTTALSASDVADLQTMDPTSVQAGSLQMYWALDETGTLSTLEDSVGTWDMTVAAGTPQASTDEPYAPPASAATYYIDTDVVGGTGDGSSWANAYSSQNALWAWAGTDGNDPVSRNETWTIYARASSGTADTTAASGSSIETDDTHTITFEVVDYTGNGSWDDTAYRVVCPNETCITWAVGDTTWKYLQVHISDQNDTGQYAFNQLYATGRPAARFEYCIFRGDNTDDYDDYAFVATHPFLEIDMYKCAIYDVADGSDAKIDVGILTIDDSEIYNKVRP